MFITSRRIFHALQGSQNVVLWQGGMANGVHASARILNASSAQKSTHYRELPPEAISIDAVVMLVILQN